MNTETKQKTEQNPLSNNFKIMQHKIYLYTRFSLPYWGKCSCISNQQKMFDSYEAYIQHLYSASRLESKIFYFENITLKTIISQTYQNFNWIIYFSDLLPTNYINFLQNIESRHKNITLIKVNQQCEKLKDIVPFHNPTDINYWSVRIDDDDGLSSDYFEILNQSYSLHYNIVGSYKCLNVSRSESSDNFVCYGSKKYGYPISCGLSVKNKHIFDMGSHASIHKRHKEEYIDINQIMSSNKNYSVQSCGDHTISQRRPVFEPESFAFDMDNYIKNKYE